MDPYSSPYVTRYGSFHFLFQSFFRSQTKASLNQQRATHTRSRNLQASRRSFAHSENNRNSKTIIVVITIIIVTTIIETCVEIESLGKFVSFCNFCSYFKESSGFALRDSMRSATYWLYVGNKGKRIRV